MEGYYFKCFQQMRATWEETHMDLENAKKELITLRGRQDDFELERKNKDAELAKLGAQLADRPEKGTVEELEQTKRELEGVMTELEQGRGELVEIKRELEGTKRESEENAVKFREILGELQKNLNKSTEEMEILAKTIQELESEKEKLTASMGEKCGEISLFFVFSSFSSCLFLLLGYISSLREKIEEESCRFAAEKERMQENSAEQEAQIS